MRNSEGALRLTVEMPAEETALGSEAFWVDLDGDGAAELILPVVDGRSAWMLTSSRGSVVGEARLIAFNLSSMLEAGDSDADGFPDQVRARGAGTIHRDDHDGDGDADVLVLDPSRRGVIILEQRGDALTAVEGGTLQLDEPGAFFEWTDDDADGDFDLVVHDAAAAAPKSLAPTGERTVPGVPDDTDDSDRRPMGGPPWDHGSELTSSSLLDDDHPRYVNTDADDTFSDSSWIVSADTGATDDKRVAIAGGGGATAADGAYISISGNDFSPSGGSVGITSGDEANSFVSLNAEGDSGSFARMNYNPDAGTPEEVLQVDVNGVSITSVGDNPLYLGEDVELKIEGPTDDANELFLDATDPTADRFITFPNADGTVAVSASEPIVLSNDGNITCPSCSTSQDRSLIPTCYTHASATPLASATTTEVTSVGSGTETPSVGIDFIWDPAGDNDHYEMQCNFIVPEDYDASSTLEPWIRIAGWSTTAINCAPLCATNVVVEFEVSSRAYSAGNRANEAWGTERTATMTWVSESCGGADCWQSDRVKNGTADLVGAASDWAAGDLVYLRIRRDAAATNELAAAVHVPRVIVTYPSE